MGKSKNEKQYEGDNMQQYINVAEIKDDSVVLKDGSLRAVLAVSSINFDLKSTSEQEAIIYAFQRFLNTLDFPIQIVISTRKFDIKPYMESLEERRNAEKNVLLREQIVDYMEFIHGLVSVSNITSKSFYVIIPFYAVESEKKNFFQKMIDTFNPRKAVFQKREEFETEKDQLFQRVAEVQEALNGTGIRMTPLNTQELIEMYYNFYNPSEFDHVHLPEMGEMMIEK